MFDDEVVLCGLAAPFGETVPYDDGFLQVEAGSFNRWLRAPDHDCELQFGSHGAFATTLASTVDGSLEFYADKVGLWFRAHIGSLNARYGIRGAITQRRNPYDQVSVSFLVHQERADRYLSCCRRRLERVSAEHIAIVDKAAFGKKTATWPEGLPLDEAPIRVQSFAAGFEDVRAASSTVDFNWAHRRQTRIVDGTRR